MKSSSIECSCAQLASATETNSGPFVHTQPLRVTSPACNAFKYLDHALRLTGETLASKKVIASMIDRIKSLFVEED